MKNLYEMLHFLCIFNGRSEDKCGIFTVLFDPLLYTVDTADDVEASSVTHDLDLTPGDDRRSVFAF